MEFPKVIFYFSPARINRYMMAMGHKQAKAIELYKANLRIACAFHPILGAVEVCLRNSVNEILTRFFSDTDWIMNQKKGFMASPSLTDQFLKQCVEQSENKLQKLRIPVSSDKIIADQSFGFWTDLFERHHYKLLSGRPIQVFKQLPSGYGRKEACERLNNIRRFRNRINHNEPVCFRGNTADFRYVENVYSAAKEVLTWMRWVNDIDTVPAEINRAKAI